MDQRSRSRSSSMHSERSNGRPPFNPGEPSKKIFVGGIPDSVRPSWFRSTSLNSKKCSLPAGISTISSWRSPLRVILSLLSSSSRSTKLRWQSISSMGRSLPIRWFQSSSLSQRTKKEEGMAEGMVETTSENADHLETSTMVIDLYLI